MERETVPLVVQPGAVVVGEEHTAVVVARGENVVALEIDLVSKYARVSGSIFGEGGPGLMLNAEEWTLDTNAEKAGTLTVVSFPGFDGWQVWAADTSKYSVLVCLVRLTEEAG